MPSDVAEYIDEAQYRKDFSGNHQLSKLHAESLAHAMRIREFEIELYWKRATYFWAFIAVIFSAYGYIKLFDCDGRCLPAVKSSLEFFSLVSCSAGLIFSFAWFLVNKGSKYWQENWENHVDMLEVAPVYRTVLERPKATCGDIPGRLLTGAGPFSVSKINQMLSAYVTLVWAYLFLWEMEWVSPAATPDWAAPAATAAVLLSFLFFGRTRRTAVRHVHAYKRKTHIIEPD